MYFLTPYLWMVLALGLPFLIHLLSKRPPKELLFPATVFLVRAEQKKFSLSKIRNLLLLLLRTFIILSLLLFFWHPQIELSQLDFQGKRKGNFILLIDQSLSMSFRHGKERVTSLDQAKNLALQLIQTFHDTSKKLVLPSEEGKGHWTYSHGVAKSLITNIKPTYGSKPLRWSLEKAKNLMEKVKKGSKEIYVISDFAPSAIQGLDQPEFYLPFQEKKIKIFFISLFPQNLQEKRENLNLFFEKVRLSPPRPSPFVPLKISFQIPPSSEKVQIRLKIDGKKVDLLQLPPGKRKGEFFWRPKKAGLFEGVLEIGNQDRLGEDNLYYIPLYVQPKKKILIFHPLRRRKYSSLFYLEKILNPAPEKELNLFQIQFKEARLLEHIPLLPFDDIFLVGIGSISKKGAKKLENFVEKGGVLLIFPPFSSPFQKGFPFPHLDRIVRAKKVLHWTLLDYKAFPFLRAFEGGQNGDLREPKIFRYATMPLKEEALWKKALIYDNEKLALGVGKLGEGNILVFTTQPDLGENNQGIEVPQRRWSTLPLNLCFPILMHEILRHLPDTDLKNQFTVGETARYRLDQGEEIIKIVGPHFKDLPFITHQNWVKVQQTQWPGIYKLKTNHKKRYAFGVNPSVFESRVQIPSMSFLPQGVQNQGVYFIPHLQDLSKYISEMAASIDLSFFFFYLALLLLVLETLVSNSWEELRSGNLFQKRYLPWKKS